MIMIKGVRRPWLNLGILMAVLVSLLTTVDIRSVVDAIMSVPLSMLTITFLLATADRFAMGYKWYHLIQAVGGRIRLRDVVSAYYQAALSSRLLPIPVGAELLRLHVLCQAGLPKALVFGSMMMEKLIAWLASSMLGFAGLLYLLAAVQHEIQSMLFVATLFSLGAGSAILVLALHQPVHHIGGRLIRRYCPPKVFGLLHKVSRATLVYRDRLGTLVVNLWLAVGEQCLQVTKFFVLGSALGVTLPIVLFFAIISVMIVVRRITAYFESWGLSEAGTVVMLTVLGVNQDISVAIVFLNYAVTIVAALPGLYLMYRGSLGLRENISKIKQTLLP